MLFSSKHDGGFDSFFCFSALQHFVFCSHISHHDIRLTLLFFCFERYPRPFIPLKKQQHIASTHGDGVLGNRRWIVYMRSLDFRGGTKLGMGYCAYLDGMGWDGMDNLESWVGWKYMEPDEYMCVGLNFAFTLTYVLCMFCDGTKLGLYGWIVYGGWSCKRSVFIVGSCECLIVLEMSGPWSFW